MRNLSTEYMIPEELSLYLSCQYGGKGTKQEIITVLEQMARLREERDEIALENQQNSEQVIELENKTQDLENTIEALEKERDELQEKLDAANAVIGAIPAL
jgi:uncharacterized coiled-coil DUF342 family protein